MDYITILLISLRAAVVAMLLMLPIAGVAAWFIARSSSRLRHVVDVMVTLPLALPPVVVGFALLWLVGARGPFSGALSGLAYTWIMMSVAAAIVALPLTVRAFTAALADVEQGLEQTARNLGASRLRVLMSVTFPLARRGLAAGMLLGFVRAFAEFGATIVVAGNIPNETMGIPSAIWIEVSTGDYSSAWILAAVSLAIGLVALIAHHFVARSGNRNTASGRHQIAD